MWHSHFITAPDGVRIHLYRIPAEGMPIVCLHGFAEYGLHWDRFTRPWQGIHDLIAFDARAHGGTDAPPTRYSLEERTGDAIAVLDALGLDRVMLLGHSLGAHIAANLAALQPDRAAGVILVDPSWKEAQLSDGPAERQREYDTWKGVVESWLKRSPERLRTIVERSFPRWEAEDVDRWLEGKALMHADVMLPGLLEPMRPWTEIAAGIRAPGLILTGDVAAGAHLTPKVAQRVSDLWPAAQVIRFDGAGHYAHLDAFEAAQAIMNEFIANIA